MRAEEHLDGPQAPPTGFGPTLLRIGPGLVLAGSIVGSGELIATTTTGAQAGFTLLWLVLAGCLVKVFAQVEFGRAAVARGCTALGALDELPGPRLRVGWGVWAWVAMTLLTLAQQGGIVGGVGSTLAQSVPLTDAGRARETAAEEVTELQIAEALARMRGDEELAARSADSLVAARAELASVEQGSDAVLWAGLVTLLTCALLFRGRYDLIQVVSTWTVAGFTLLTVATVVLLQLQDEWAVRASELAEGLSLSLPPAREGVRPLATALATFGMIGVGAAELVAYPYWCLEKGYARWTGSDDGSPAWTARARGWLRVMRLDAWFSAGVYTFATLAFYLLGAGVLGRVGLDPGRQDLVRTLAAMYEPVFGAYARPVFLVGAFCVLYSTFFVASAGMARIAADAVVRLGLAPRERGADCVRWLSVAFPLISFGVFAFVQAPLGLVLAGGVAQALLLPVLGAAALHQRYRRTRPELAPGRLWDTALWVSAAGFTVAGGWTLVNLLGS